MAKPKTIKPVLAWGVHDRKGRICTVAYKQREDATCSVYMDDVGAKAVRVEIRDAATAKLERAALDALLMYSRTNRQVDLDEAKAHAAQILEVRK
jgi:hypothetical protein